LSQRFGVFRVALSCGTDGLVLSSREAWVDEQWGVESGGQAWEAESRFVDTRRLEALSR